MHAHRPDTISNPAGRTDLWSKVVGLTIIMTMLVAMVTTANASAQLFEEPDDFRFVYESMMIDGEERDVRKDWNRFGGATAIPYFINQGVLDADSRYELAIVSAFETYTNDAGSNISFEYQGSTTTVSEARPGVTPVDGINVVSFGDLPAGVAARSEFAGDFVLDSSGWPTGVGDGQFDLTIANDVPLGVGALPGVIDLETIILHEVGHVVGLDHPTANPSAVMHELLTDQATRRSLTAADSSALAMLYPNVVSFVLCQAQVVTQNMNMGASSIGTASGDVILGTPASDIIDGGGGDDVICAGAGDDQVVGNTGNDSILGEAGNDVLRGGPDEDNIAGGTGNDRVLGGTGADVLTGGDGRDFLGGFGGDDQIDGGIGDDTIFGGFGADTINGGPGNDKIHGLIGNDTINGDDGNDTLDGDRGNDTINGGRGDDMIRGGNANDILSGDAGNDSVNGGKADDALSGGPGTDVCTGNNQIVADTADATCETKFGVP